ncbi:PAS domain-containing protein [Mucilaginibacter sp. KACC 22773]|uniref:PAS domain-containing protein n=1 Tax=Mucilaginibacter sp. KACC 22773 TaxID=3025671 RepID=UPI00236603D8|nr:PAS domain-containing protein [Mucilaginibacter sp. KACC 22773]WDF78609.1 PAS domain-containing protein [Mucilaginibacter sp. KACC 22773]
MRHGALRIALIYIIISLLWITFGDRLLFQLQDNFTREQVLLISSAKGYFFVLASGLFLYYLIKRNDKQLLQRESQYRNMYEANPVPMWIYDEALNIVSVNDAAVSTYGYTRAEFLTKSILDISPPEDAEKAIESARNLSPNLNLSGTWRHIKKDGSVIQVSITSHKITFNNSPNVLVMVRDMTEQLLFEQRLEKINQEILNKKRNLRETQLISKVGGWEYFPDTRKLLWSDELYALTGISKDDEREPFDIYLEHIFPEDRPMMIAGLNDLMTNGKTLDVTHRTKVLNGETRYMRQLARLESVPGMTLKVIGSMQDITELKELEVEKNRHLSNLENTLNSISDAFFALDYNMCITRINQAFEDIVNGRFTKIVGESIFTLFPKERNRMYPYYQKALEERVIVRMEEYSMVLNKWIRLAAYPTDDGVAVYFSDITENKLKDIKLKEAVERYELLAQATKDVIYDLNIPADTIVYNASLTQLIDVSYEQITYNLEWWRSLIHPDDVAEVVTSQQKIKNEGKTNWACEYRINCGNGIYKYIMDQGYFIYNEQKEPVRLIGVIKDINDLKQSIQENKRQNEFLKEVAWLSSHEIRRPVATMLGLMYLVDIADSNDEKEEAFELLKVTINEMDGIVHLIHNKINDAVDLS